MQSWTEIPRHVMVSLLLAAYDLEMGDVMTPTAQTWTKGCASAGGSGRRVALELTV